MTRELINIGNVIPKDIKLFYEDGIPYIHYVGITYIDGCKVEITIPKMDLYLHDIDVLAETRYAFGANGITVPVRVRQNAHAVSDTLFTVRFIDED